MVLFYLFLLFIVEQSLAIYDPISNKIQPNADSSSNSQQQQHHHHHTCMHDEFIKTWPKPIDVDLYPKNDDRKRIESGTTFNYIRMDLNVDNLANAFDANTCFRTGQQVILSDGARYSCRSDDVLSSEKRTWLNKLLAKADSILSASLKVRTVTNFTLNGLSKCGNAAAGSGATIPSRYQDGSQNIDLVVFVTARPIAKDGVLAFAASCATDSTYKRPVAGYLNYSPASLKVDTNFNGQVGTTLHEITHVLGFSGPLFSNFYKLNETANGSATTTKTVSGASRDYIKTPKVLQFVKSHTGCTTAHGAEIEGGGGSGTTGSHWEKRVYQNEFMTGSSSSDPIYSELTMKFFEDSGWYETNVTRVADYETKFLWGFGRGCGFLNDECVSKTSGWPKAEVWPGYTCSDSLETGCSFDMRAKARCGLTDYSTPLPTEYQYFPGEPRKGGLSQLADYCPFFSNTDVCTASDKKGSGGEVYGADSRCFVNNVANIGGGDVSGQLGAELSAVTQAMGCYRSFCSDIGGNKLGLRIVVEGVAYSCKKDADIDVEGRTGTIKCPPQAQLDAVCEDLPQDDLWPEVDSVDPTSGQPEDTVTVTGRHFEKGATVIVDAECKVKFISSTKLEVTLPSQENFKDPRHLSVFSKLQSKKSIVVENPKDKDGVTRKGILKDSFEMNIDFDLNAFEGFLDLMARHPMQTAIIGIAMLLGLLCCLYCCCSSGKGGNRSQKSRRGEYYF